MKVIRTNHRGYFNHGWLKTHHTFSFGDYYNPEAMGFRSLRVINEDFVQPGEGFDTHGHRDMEIITYVLEGELAHKDSMGNGSVIKAGDTQYMSAGSGVTHSEFNNSAESQVHLLQIWILPNQKSLKPQYGQLHLSREQKLNTLRLFASLNGRDNSMAIRQDADVYASVLEGGKSLEFKLRAGRGVWVQVAKGQIEVEGQELRSGDAAVLEDSGTLKLKGLGTESELILFDLK
ncbi:MAG: pirin family protein [Oligoflexia bacterium]|nr:pirin family protein [Oligoflexia bacterium]